jgi:hypothetical protein
MPPKDSRKSAKAQRFEQQETEVTKNSNSVTSCSLLFNNCSFSLFFAPSRLCVRHHGPFEYTDGRDR